MKVAVRMKRLAYESGLSLSQFAIAWILSQPEVDMVSTSILDAETLDTLIPATQITLDSTVLRTIDEMLDEATTSKSATAQ